MLLKGITISSLSIAPSLYIKKFSSIKILVLNHFTTEKAKITTIEIEVISTI